MTVQTTDTIAAPGLNRRDLIKAGLAGCLGLVPLFLMTPEARASSFPLPGGTGEFTVRFHNEYTGEVFDGPYRVGDKYLPDSFDRINQVLRDFRTDEVFPIDPRVMDIIHAVYLRSGADAPFRVLSGYRSPKTNAMLERTKAGVARNSLHLTGQAIDLYLPDYRTHRLRDIAMNLGAGGVGYYPESNFIHMDTGLVRHWTGY